jgi:hypothetical protein
MTQLAAAVKTKIEAAVPAQVLLPSMLAVNTLVLLALDSIHGVPSWIKTAATLFLAF